MWGRKYTLLRQLHWIPHHAGTLRLWRERISLLSAEASPQLSQGIQTKQRGFCLGVLHSYRLKRRKSKTKHPKKEPETMEFIQHCAMTQLKNSAFTVRQISSPHYQALSDFQPWSWWEELGASIGAPRFLGSSLCKHTANKQDSGLPSFRGTGKHFWATLGLLTHQFLTHMLNKTMYWTVKLCIPDSKSSSVPLSAESLKPEIISLALFPVFRYFFSDI